VFKEIWALLVYKIDPAMKLTSKLKATRKHLKDWQKSIPKLATTIDNIKLVIQFLDLIEESRDLQIHEWNFREILQAQLGILLDW
jgi:thymidylate synthase